MKKKKKTMLLVFLVTGVLFFVGLYVYIVRPKPAKLTILVAPVDSTVLINGKAYKNGTFEIAQGKYTVSIDKDGFERKEVDLTVEKDSHAKLYEYLEPAEGYYSEKDFDLLKYLAKDEEKRELIKKREISKQIARQLPYIDNKMVIRQYIDSDECRQDPYLCLVVTKNKDVAEDEVTKAIENLGFDPTSFKIVYAKEEGI